MIIKDELKQQAMEVLVTLKKYGYIAGVVMVVLGVAIFLRPIATTVFLLWMLVIGLLVDGVYRFIIYFKLPQFMRDGWQLAIAIMWIVCAILMMIQVAGAPLETTISMQVFVGLIIGFNCIFSGVGNLCMAGRVKEVLGSSGLVILSGILEIVCGVIVVSAPVAGLLAITLCFGVYLTVMGVALIIRSIAY